MLKQLILTAALLLFPFNLYASNMHIITVPAPVTCDNGNHIYGECRHTAITITLDGEIYMCTIRPDCSVTCY